jgi:hypothetical protein
MSTSAANIRAASIAIARPTNPFLRRLVLCAVLTVFNGIVIAKYAGVLYLATSHHRFEQAGVTLLFVALLGSLARTWFITLSNRPR